MADLVGFKVQTTGGVVRVYGTVVDSSNQSIELASFGQAGVSFVTWFQGLPSTAQEEFVNNAAVPYMVRNLLGQWPISIPNGRQPG